MNKSIESMGEVGAAIKEIVQYRTIRGNLHLNFQMPQRKS